MKTEHGEETEAIDDLTEACKPFIEAARNMIWAVDQNYCLIFSNQSFIDHTRNGLGKVFNKGDNLWRDLDESLTSIWKLSYDRVLHEGAAITVEIPLHNQEFEYVQAFDFSPVMLEKQPNPSGVLVISHDISGLKNEIKKSEVERTKHRSFLEQTEEMLYLHDILGNILEVNEAALRKTGYSRDELIHMTVFDIDPIARERGDQTNIWEKLRTDIPVCFETQHLKKDKTSFPVQVKAFMIQMESENYVMALVNDWSIRKELEDSLNSMSDFTKKL